LAARSGFVIFKEPTMRARKPTFLLALACAAAALAGGCWREDEFYKNKWLQEVNYHHKTIELKDKEIELLRALVENEKEIRRALAIELDQCKAENEALKVRVQEPEK
jgi:hypothetical protein